MPPLGRRLLIVLKRHEHMAGFVHFFRPKIQGLFKDFGNFKDLFFIYVEEFTHGNSLTVQFLLIFCNVDA